MTHPPFEKFANPIASDAPGPQQSFPETGESLATRADRADEIRLVLWKAANLMKCGAIPVHKLELMS